MRTNTPKLSVVIPTLNRNSHLVDTVRQVLSDQFKELEVIVVDQSDDHDYATWQYINGVKDSRFHYYQVRPKSGVAAKNFGLGRASADIVVFLDDDIALEAQCLSAHYAAFLKHPEIGGVAGRVKQEGTPVSDKLLYFDRFGICPYLSFNYTKGQITDTAPGGNMSVRRDAAIEVGGFDTNFVRSQHREESEFSARYFRAGHKFWFEPDACILHLAAPSGGTRHKGDFADHPDFYQNNLYFVLKYCRLKDLPVALLVQLRFYALRKNPVISFRRVVLFAWGLAVAFKRLVKPNKITPTLIKELP